MKVYINPHMNYITDMYKKMYKKDFNKYLY